NHFFKNNYLFKQWTRADRVLDDFNYAKSYITHCEEKFGYRRVEQLLDSAHALMSHAVDRYAPIHRDRKSQRQKAEDRARYEEQHFNDLWRTVPTTSDRDSADDPKVPKLNLVLPADNVLKFVALHSPRLEPWQREILKIVCRNAQYFYPQRQTKVMNEGCATFVHYTIMNRMYDLGLIDEGSMLEFLRSHSSVIQQAGFDHRAFHGFNPYALGFAMMRDIERICVDPDDEDHHWFPDIAGCGEAWAVLRNAWAEYRDESFILQFLSPRLIREMHLFAVSDRGEMPFLRVNAIHDEVGYRDIRSQLASMYDLSNQTPQIEVRGADLEGNRRLLLVHRGRDGKRLNSETAGRVLNHLAFLWGYGVRLDEEDSEGRFLEKHEAFPMPTDG
ncbi:MAG: SpoVR family protein, partial [Planctomycetota bacterium]